jgi:hypothetical protein
VPPQRHRGDTAAPDALVSSAGMARRRRSTTVTLALACALAFSACGGNSGTPSNDAAVIPADANHGTDALTCSALPCLANATGLIAYCAPSGTCTVQVTVSGGIATMTKCFSNGVTIQLTATNAAAGGTNTVMAVRKDGAACYSFTAMGTADASVGSAVYQDGAGADLFTEMVDGANATYTCPGRAPIGENTSCDAALFALQGLYPFSNAICPSGPCTF